MKETLLDQSLEQLRGKVEEALQRWLLPESEVPGPLRDAVEYAVFPGGKRLRPVLALLACRAFGGRDQDALPAAAALEMIHCYSLVHDDLPAMDDDDLRRGRPTCHKKFGEAVAILAGDALLTRAFETVARHSPDHLQGPLTAEIAAAAGVAGMVAGQAADLLAEGSTPSEETVTWIHRRKTAELIRVAVRAGALAGGCIEEHREAVDGYGVSLGLCFQVVDDLLGRRGDAADLGKPVGRDDERGKLTYPYAMGEVAAEKRVGELTEVALRWAQQFPQPDDLLTLAERLRTRIS